MTEAPTEYAPDHMGEPSGMGRCASVESASKVAVESRKRPERSKGGRKKKREGGESKAAAAASGSLEGGEASGRKIVEMKPGESLEFRQRCCCVSYLNQAAAAAGLGNDASALLSAMPRLTGEDEVTCHSHHDLKHFNHVPPLRRERVAMVLEDCMQRLAADGVWSPPPERQLRGRDLSQEDAINQRLLRSQFLLHWLIIKIIETILSVMCLITFYHEGSYFEDAEGFLPILVTLYITLSTILITKLIYITFFNVFAMKNPHTLLYIITSALLTLVMSSGELVLLGLSGYFHSELQVVVYVFAAILELCLLTELYLCYCELKRLWTKVGQSNR